MDNPISFISRSKHSTPFINFSLFVLIHIMVAYFLVWYLFNGIWNRELLAGIGKIILTFVFCHFIFSLGEYLFHRYILHAPTYEVMIRFYKKHVRHHQLTSIYIDESGHKINSAYAIDSIERDVAATFPPWTLAAFLGGFIPVFLILALFLPGIPIVICGCAALSLSYYLYEVVHVVHHELYEICWERKINSPFFGILWRKIYGFHQAHHANYKCNLHVGGFFGVPVGDFIFGTYKQPRELLLPGIPATKEMIQELHPKPRWPITLFDRISQRRKTRILSENSKTD